jgi:Spy/CpxP family protein refolding chaperone
MEGMEEMPGMTGGMRPMGMMGRMGMADRPFFLDRVKELGLSDEQVRKLKEIRQKARVDSIRAAAELRIARLELRDLLAGEWKLETAEKLVRNVQKMQGDLKVRFLKAKKEAEKVLTPEQLKMAQGGEEELEGLFR